MRVRITAKPGNRQAAAAATKAARLLKGKATVTNASPDLVMSFGGDGTMLRTARALGPARVPVLGVNCGDVGFLTDISAKDLGRALPRIARGDFCVEERTRLECCGMLALNDIVVAPAKPALAMRYSLWLDGEKVWDDCGDGLIVATPTGSTAYAFSAGGPVVPHGSPVLVIATMNSVGRKPALVVPDGCRIELRGISSPAGCEVVADGQERKRCPGRIAVRKSRHPIMLVRLGAPYAGLCAKLKKKVGSYGV